MVITILRTITFCVITSMDLGLVGVASHKCKGTDAIYLDYAKAFEKVDHRLLLAKLHKHGFSSHFIT